MSRTAPFSAPSAAPGSGTRTEPLVLPAPAKLNRLLHITGRRPDGYHELQTLFQFLDVGDTLTLRPRADGDLHLTPRLDGVTEEDNLILRAARLLQAESGTRLGADIHLDKRLPMGGGSAAAARMPPPPCSASTPSGGSAWSSTLSPASAFASAPTSRCSCAATPPGPRASASA